MSNAYKLAPTETVWTDDCSVCPDHVLFDVDENCDRQSVVDGRCFRGDWSDDNGWFEYDFELPPEWGAAVDFRYTFDYWSLGTWQNDEESQEEGGSYADNELYTFNNEEDDMSKNRDSQTECRQWRTWQPSDGALDPYSMWQAADGDIGLNLACYYPRKYIHKDFSDTNLYVGFWVGNHVSSSYGLSGPRSSEAWVVSDFQIQFWPKTAITNSYYDLGAAEYKWADPCSECLPSIEFQASTSRMTCETLVSSDGRCFRGDFGEENDFLTYLFQLPSAWQLPADFRLTATFWALGGWDLGFSNETAVVEHCSETDECTRHLEKGRNSETNCNGWQQWSQPTDDSTFTPFQWVASRFLGNNTSCFWPVNVSVSGWTADKLKIRFGVWDTLNNDWGLSGGVNNEAWVVSDFQIEFWPQNRRSTTRVPTTTTSKPSTTTTSSLSTTTTASNPTTTTSTPTTTVYLSSATPKTRTTSTAVPDTSTELSSSTPKPTTTTSESSTSPSSKSTAIPQTTADGDSEHSGNDALEKLAIGFGVVFGAVAVISCALCAYYSKTGDCDWRKAARSKESTVVIRINSDVQMQRVVSHSQVEGGSEAKFPASVVLQTAGGRIEDVRECVAVQLTPGMNAGDAVADEDLDDEMMYIPMSEPRATPGAVSSTLEAIIAKMQLAARSGEEIAIARKLRMALTMAPAKMEEGFGALLQMGADEDDAVWILADTAESVLSTAAVAHLQSLAAATHGESGEGEKTV